MSMVRYDLQKSEGEYESALASVARGIHIFREIPLLIDPPVWIRHMRKPQAPSDQEREKAYKESDVRRLNDQLKNSAPWMDSLNPQGIADCFEAVRSGRRIKDTQLFVSTCEKLLNLCIETPWLKPLKPEKPLFSMGGLTMQSPGWSTEGQKEEQLQEIQDGEGKFWEPIQFWQRACWWAENKLEPSELQDLIQSREDTAAEKRIRYYFLDDELWELMPTDAKPSLINTDRDWFSGSNSRVEALLNELRITVEKIMLHGLWQPIEKWLADENRRPENGTDFLALKMDLAQKGLTPDINHFGQVCGMEITRDFLARKGLPKSEIDWFCHKLPGKLKGLRSDRRRAEHGNHVDWSRPRLKKFVAEFFGIGQYGIIPRLVRVLFLPQ